jgi:hypothetical protein
MATAPASNSVSVTDNGAPIDVANDGAPPLNGIAIGALVFAVLFCAAGAVMWYLARKRQAVMKI